MISPQEIAISLRVAYLTMHRQTNARLVKYGVTADQFVCLSILSDKDAITQQELVKRATSDPNTMRAMLVLLEKQGLIERIPHPTDRRARLVKLTPSGRKTIDKLVNELKPLHIIMSSAFQDCDASKFVETLNRFTDTILKTAGAVE